MARGLTLEQLIFNLCIETGVSTNAAVNRSMRERFVGVLNRVQRRLHTDYDWPFLTIERDIQLQAGQRYYDFPDDIDMDRSFRTEVKWGGDWLKMGYGINNTHLAQYDSDQDVRSDPCWRWDYFLPDGANIPQMEVWPMPATDGVVGTQENYLRVHGIHKLAEMVNDADTCLIDADIVVLYAAAELLAKRRSPDAESKLANANALYTKLKDRATPSKAFKIGGECLPPSHGSDGYHRMELRTTKYVPNN